jgi:GT2 family glycosyltransferase
MAVDAFVSVIVPTRNRAALLSDCLRSLRSQDYPMDRYEIVVVDDGSTDGTRDVVRAVAEAGGGTVRLVSQPASGINAARNRGIGKAAGELVCFVDDDVVAPGGWLRAFVSGAIRYPDVGVFAGRIRTRFEAATPRICGEEPVWEGYDFDLGDEDVDTDRAWGCNLALRPDAISLAGPFDETLRLYGDDVEWEFRYLRAGGRIAYVADALVWHRRTAESLRMPTLMRRSFRLGRGRVHVERVVGRAGFSIGQDVERAMRGLGHRLRRGCNWGLFVFAESVGRLWGRVRFSRRGVTR